MTIEGPATTQNLVVKFDGEICGGVLVENASDDFPQQMKLENLLPNFATNFAENFTLEIAGAYNCNQQRREIPQWDVSSCHFFYCPKGFAKEPTINVPTRAQTETKSTKRIMLALLLPERCRVTRGSSLHQQVKGGKAATPMPSYPGWRASRRRQDVCSGRLLLCRTSLKSSKCLSKSTIWWAPLAPPPPPASPSKTGQFLRVVFTSECSR